MTPQRDAAADHSEESAAETEVATVNADTAVDEAADETIEAASVEPPTVEAPQPESDDDPDIGSTDTVAAEVIAKAPSKVDYWRVVAFGLLPAVALILAGAAGYLKWQDSSMRASRTSGVECLTAARDGTIAMLSYQPDTVEKDLNAARDRLTGTFKDSYTQLTHDMVIPGAKQRHISAVATVPGVASVSATATHAVALVFVNQTVVIGKEPPSATASTVRVTLDKVNERWLISGFDPV